MLFDSIKQDWIVNFPGTERILHRDSVTIVDADFFPYVPLLITWKCMQLFTALTMIIASSLYGITKELSKSRNNSEIERFKYEMCFHVASWASVSRQYKVDFHVLLRSLPVSIDILLK